MPPFPFPSAHAYYIWASSHESLEDIRVPLLAVNAKNDPIVRCIPSSAGGNGMVALAVTSSGGHLGWFESNVNSTIGARVKRWISEPVVEWLRASDDVVNIDYTDPMFTEEGGFVTQIGFNNLGYRFLCDAGEIKGIEGEGGLLPGL